MGKNSRISVKKVFDKKGKYTCQSAKDEVKQLGAHEKLFL